MTNNKNRINEIWETRVREQVKPAEGQTSLALSNTLGLFLDELATTFKQVGSSSIQSSPEQGMSEVHGGNRATFAGYFLPQLLKEFSILREVITEILHEEEVLTFEVRAVVDKAIDSAISLSSTEFAAVQQASTKSALQRAEMSNLDLEHFAAVAAHDLKSPLATISSYLDLLADDEEKNLKESSIEYIELMQKASERMRNLIDRLLEFASLSTADKPFTLINTNEVVKAALQNLSDIIDRTNAKVTYSHLPFVSGDVDLLIQLFQNLIANSIKFGKDQPPEILIEAKDNNGSWLFSVKDNGIGFDTKNKEEIFALYKKLHGGVKYQGTGIGLASCRRVVELHGGRIWAESSLGQGSTFFFTLMKKNKAQPDHH